MAVVEKVLETTNSILSENHLEMWQPKDLYRKLINLHACADHAMIGIAYAKELNQLQELVQNVH